MQNFRVKGKEYQLPIYLPDATLGFVKRLSFEDISRVGIEGAVVNTYHLYHHLGQVFFDSCGGIKSFANWSGLTASDSGGFQIMSLVKRGQLLAKIADEGIIIYSGPHKRHRRVFSPEESVRMQFSLASDLVICLDDFTPHGATEEQTRQTVDRTLSWAERCRAEFDRQVAERKLGELTRPLILGVIQGGTLREERKRCAQGLMEIGFDGFGFGGWPVDKEGRFDLEIASFVASLTPDNKLRFALGVGKPKDIRQCFVAGYHIFDCVLPTRDARHGRLYQFSHDSCLDITRTVFASDFSPVEEGCDCPLCRNYTRAYLHHLFKCKDPLAGSLASLHNLRVYARVIEDLRKGS